MTRSEPGGAQPSSDAEMRILETDARYAHERAVSYRALMMTSKRPTVDNRMRHLEHVERSTAERLRRARDQRTG